MGERESWSSIADELRAMGCDTQAKKLTELVLKKMDGDLYIAFCGHFSAGKSTLVNRLCGHRLLPSSPIPTSANVVRIRNGEASARIYRKTGCPAGVEMERIPLDMLETACKDGDEIETVEIRYPVPLLGDHTVLLDTPGIDSTDDAHKAATQSAMHLADAVCYVMDYNYVQSEINFTFAKKLQDAGKPLYLIVNQIDKHREQELSFESYREGVSEAFRNWNIEPAGILFLSLKDEDFPNNDWGKLPALIRSLIEQSSPLKTLSMRQAVIHLIREAIRDWKESRKLEKARFRKACGEEHEIQKARDEEKLLGIRMDNLHGKQDDSMIRWKKELQSIIDNANLTPAVTRDLAAAYLETRKPGYKRGLFSRASKTEEERARRLEAFRQDMEEKARAHLYWHAADYIKQLAVREGMPGAELHEALELVQVRISADWLAGQVHAGPDFTGEYVLNYCRMIAEEVKRQCRQACWTVLERLLAHLAVQTGKDLQQLTERSRELAVRLAAARGLEVLNREEREQEQSLMQTAEQVFTAAGHLQLPEVQSLEAYSTIRKADSPYSASVCIKASTYGYADLPSGGIATITAPSKQSGETENEPFPPANLNGRLTDTADRLIEAASVLEGMEGASLWVQTLMERASKLRDNRFTLALFGAFSAGKSSFANALMGLRALPASPNPTTAAINTILPPNAIYPNGTVRVLLKSEQEIVEEIAYSLRAMGLEVSDTEQRDPETLLKRIRGLEPRAASASGKPHYTFLKAVEKGWPEMASHLGGEVLAGSDQFHGFVAVETQSCFVSLVELYQETPLSAHGVVLVDTPGADSINARHTGVAFNYMKNADAILFVTYYNHAFSQADREFLLQLGRVKDAMQLDKMFFIVNAADLASGPEELAGVLKHVEDNLLRFGIRNPRLYPVSSLMAVEGKINGEAGQVAVSGILDFEAAFHRFAASELADLAVQGAENELRRAAALMDQWIRAARQNAGERERSLSMLAGAEKVALEGCGLHLYQEDRGGLRKELEEQLYYVKQRTGFRFAEFYRMAFNPSALREDGRDMKQAFKAAWRDLLRMMGLHLSQEVLAVTLRLEQFMNRLMEEKWAGSGKALQGILEGYVHSGYDQTVFQTPLVDEMPAVEEPEVKWLLGFYRSGRQFFEGDGSVKLLQALEGWFTEPVDRYVKEHAARLAEDYLQQLERQADLLSERAAKSVQSHCGGLRAAFSPAADSAALMRKKEVLDRLLSNHK